MFDIYHTILNLLINTCIIVFDQSIPVANMYTCTIIAGGGVLNIVQNTKKITFQNLCNIYLHVGIMTKNGSII